MQTERSHEIGGLKLPLPVWAIDHLEANRQPVDASQDGRGVQASGSQGFLQLENNLGLDPWGTIVQKRKLGNTGTRLMDGVIVHVSPNHSVEAHLPPHRFVRISQLPAD